MDLKTLNTTVSIDMREIELSFSEILPNTTILSDKISVEKNKEFVDLLLAKYGDVKFTVKELDQVASWLMEVLKEVGLVDENGNDITFNN